MLMAHLAGVPAEELLVPWLSTGGGLIVVARHQLASWRRRRHRHLQSDRPCVESRHHPRRTDTP
jgi:hypothetical protein